MVLLEFNIINNSTVQFSGISPALLVNVWIVPGIKKISIVQIVDQSCEIMVEFSDEHPLYSLIAEVLIVALHE